MFHLGLTWGKYRIPHDLSCVEKGQRYDDSAWITVGYVYIKYHVGIMLF